MGLYSGLNASFNHPENGMSLKDMEACQRVANKRNEVILFRSTGPWAKRWIERGYPTKGFHVKGKSSDWGPQAGFVPYLGEYSKVGHDPAKAAEGTKQNDKGIASGHAAATPLVLTMEEIDMQVSRPEGHPLRRAIYRKDPAKRIAGLTNSRSAYVLYAQRSGDNRGFQFIAQFTRSKQGYPICDQNGKPIMVMTTSEVGTDKPMTGDYDLFAICPTWGQYGNTVSSDFTYKGTKLKSGQHGQSQAFYAGQGLDSVLDTRLYTGGMKQNDYFERLKAYEKRNPSPEKPYPGRKYNAELKKFESEKFQEHADMGNITPRILQCVMDLNTEMGAGGQKSVLRRVHHNAESGRHANFGALTGKQMEGGEGLPITVFQPNQMGANQRDSRPALAATGYGTIDTIVSFAEFKDYVVKLSAAGYYVPKHWAWGMEEQSLVQQRIREFTKLGR
ncbi:MAG: hypothetical protein BWK79_02935 [Beggiatoa sp. IS2]|nr:MAG: hypothetical protein BWK79_02935 [Beggiatoa sp. IS2]